MVLGRDEVYVIVSIGIIFYLLDGIVVDELLKNVNVVMYYV